MEKPESEMTALELRLKWALLAEETAKVPTGNVRHWIDKSNEATRVYDLAKKRQEEESGKP